jgi:hypothetical protein
MKMFIIYNAFLIKAHKTAKKIIGIKKLKYLNKSIKSTI